jgi:hypothetical protein
MDVIGGIRGSGDDRHGAAEGPGVAGEVDGKVFWTRRVIYHFRTI